MATYYRVPEKYDGVRLINKKANWYELTKDELFTAKECDKLGLKTSLLESVKLGPKKAYRSFGKRFEIK